MSKITNLIMHIFAALLAFVAMLIVLLSIAYFNDLYTPSEKQGPPLLAITGATVLVGDALSPVDDATVIIGGDRILRIQASESVPRNAEILPADGLVVMPALFDAAAYFEAPAGEEVGYMSGEWAWEITRSLPEHRRALLGAGVTFLNDLASGPDSVIRTRALLEQGELAGPMLRTAGAILTAPGGFPDAAVFPMRLAEAVRIVPSVQEGQGWVQELAARGVDSISVSYTSLGGRFAQLDRSVLAAIIEEAHGYGLPVAVQTASLAEASQAVELGADVLVGGVTLADEQFDGLLLAAMVKQGTILIPTLAAVEARQVESNESLASAMVNVRLAHQAGVLVLAGSGTAGATMTYGTSLQWELVLLSQAGLSPAEALQAGTLLAAEWHGVGDRLGRVDEGMQADLVLLGGNPLDDLGNLGDVQLVIQNGVVMVDNRASE